MPKPTFFNLAEKKRQNITELAIAEFASADYDNASISNIVKQAKIAKGSFYQYFENKEDLYLYLIEAASRQRIDFIQASQSSAQFSDFFAELRWFFVTSTKFSAQYPQLSQILNRAVYGDSPVKEAVLHKIRAAGKKPIQDLVDKGIVKGDLRPTLDPDLATFLILSAGNSLRYFIPEKLSIDTRKLAEGSAIEVDMQAVERIFDELIEILKRGMRQL